MTGPALSTEEIRDLTRQLATLVLNNQTAQNQAIRWIDRLGQSTRWEVIPYLAPFLICETWTDGRLLPWRRKWRQAMADSTATAISQLLSRVPAASWMTLDERFRRMPSRWPTDHTTYWSRWRGFSSQGIEEVLRGDARDLDILGVLSCHPNGWLRQRAVELLDAE